VIDYYNKLAGKLNKAAEPVNALQFLQGRIQDCPVPQPLSLKDLQ
jgi:hypothetical protein